MAKIEVVVEYQDGMSLDPADTVLERSGYPTIDQARTALYRVMPQDRAALDCWLEIDGQIVF